MKDSLSLIFKRGSAILSLMRKFLMILSVFAFLATSVAGLAHAETLCDPSSEICTSQHVDSNNAPDNDLSPDGCDLGCSGGHVHCHGHPSIASYDNFSLQASMKDQRAFGKEAIYISDFVYGLKRPPRA
jgi:hypothetical protein